MLYIFHCTYGNYSFVVDAIPSEVKGEWIIVSTTYDHSRDYFGSAYAGEASDTWEATLSYPPNVGDTFYIREL